MSDPVSHSLRLLWALAAGVLLYLYISRNRRRLPVPPGPPGLPIIGNLLQAPKSEVWKVYQKWSQQYGPVIAVKYGHKTSIILSSAQVVHELLGRRSLKYSERPKLIGLDQVTRGLHSGLMPYGPRWRAARALQGTFLRPSIARKYRPLQEVQSQRVIHDLLTTNDFSRCFHRFVTGLFLTLAYGMPMWPDQSVLEEWDALSRRKAHLVEPAFSVTGPMAEFFPFLTCLPAKWQDECNDMYNGRTRVFGRYLRMAQSAKSWNWVKQQSTHKAAQELDATEHAHVMGSLGEAALTPYHALRTILLAIYLHPVAVAQAQAELDRVVGTDRLPTFEDIPQLPYVNAFIKEAVRWRTVMPMFTPRVMREDDEYMGYHIPNGSTVLLNQWAIDHDESTFPMPEEFRPERWIDDPSLPSFFFGLGHRACPGEQVGNDSLFIVTSRVLWAFHVGKDREGCDIQPQSMYKSVGSTFINPVPHFDVCFTPRDQARQSLIEEGFDAAEKDASVLLDQIKDTCQAI
ncbi:hypothetical protein ASPWEDRAFT_46637 [Aspergillus wentii DTO 134E9]|uniref:Cytochrome P450 n=1 Tax=Aspergillus wentii DTO 134E9 TaxID=1073089 RepID=A0A1L9R4L8_ASPWE|nr:uncharacterized protein ASPWEDRAFT_46637 [Aspergillus wentii DTO 134E9]OJJ29875.1 hypothetical protein ASPWEDRAFT_46637 [Aspergillus wentii DTO 134E9]